MCYKANDNYFEPSNMFINRCTLIETIHKEYLILLFEEERSKPVYTFSNLTSSNLTMTQNKTIFPELSPVDSFSSAP